MRVYLDVASGTDAGLKRDRNEDWVIAEPKHGIFVICDGVAGHEDGEVAAELAAKAFADHVRRFRVSLSGAPRARSEQMRRMLEEAVNLAASTVRETAELRAKRMGTTLTAIVVDGGNAYVAHVGDCRAYLLRDGSMIQLTRDHTVADDLYRSGVINSEQLEVSPYRNHLSRCLGKVKHCTPDIIHQSLCKGDRLLLCSDGVFDEYVSSYLLRIDATRGTVHDAVTRLMDQANLNGGRDNISLVLMEVSDVLRDRVASVARVGSWFGRANSEQDTAPFVIPARPAQPAVA